MRGGNIDVHSKAREGKRLRVRLGTLEYRHVATFIGRLFVGLRFGEGFLEDMVIEEVEEAEMENEEENVGGRGDISEFGKAGGVTSGTMMYTIDASMLQHLNQGTLDVFGDLSEG
ncbi:Hypothetical protein D9617_83g071650 [Elsinoe fawcettii]|nr:Hypothetical protein D9617_83g071650 [Elsinoe fawcettii]